MKRSQPTFQYRLTFRGDRTQVGIVKAPSLDAAFRKVKRQASKVNRFGIPYRLAIRATR